MDQARYASLVNRFADSEIEFRVNFLELTTFLGALRLMQDHPDFQSYGFTMQQLVLGMRQAILNAMLEMGVPAPDVHAMDVLYASESGGVAFQAGPDPRKRHLEIVKMKEGESEQEEDEDG